MPREIKLTDQNGLMDVSICQSITAIGLYPAMHFSSRVPVTAFLSILKESGIKDVSLIVQRCAARPSCPLRLNQVMD